jgi:hypothetical protein
LTETLTDSFCERCGTRYEFRAPTRLNPLRKTRGFIGGLKNYLTSQDALGDAMGDAMRQQEEALAAAQLDAFHESFNFCIDCRQYTCVNCWNDDAGRCRSCAPIAGTDDLGDRLAASLAAEGGAAIAEPTLAENELQRRLGLDPWPMSDLPATESNEHAAVAWPDADAVERLEPVAAESEPEPAFEPEPFAAESEPEPAFEPEPEPAFEAEPIAVEAAAETSSPVPPLRVAAWEDDTSYDIIEPAFEAEPEPVAADAEPEPAFEAEPEPAFEPEPVAAEAEREPAFEPEPVAADAEPEPAFEPEPVAAEAEPERRIAPISETILRFPSRDTPPAAQPDRQAAQDDTPEVAARRAQLDLLGLDDAGEGPVEQRPAVLPYRSRGAAASASELAARAGRAGSTFWDASAREVASASAHIGVQNCDQCGLSLSASARFCRRCGARQARSA